MLRSVTLFVLVAGSVATASAQTRPRDRARAEDLLRERQRLELTESQVQRLQALRSQELAERRELLGTRLDIRSRLRAGELDRAGARAEMQKLMESRRNGTGRAGAAEVLTDAQRVRMLEGRLDRARMAARMGRLEGRMARGRGFDRGRPGLRDRRPDAGFVPRRGMDRPRFERPDQPRFRFRDPGFRGDSLRDS